MNSVLIKYILFIVIILKINLSFAQCNTDLNLRLIKFPPSNLAVYLSPESTVEVHDFDDGENASVEYVINYKGRNITIFNIFNRPNYSLRHYTDKDHILPLPNIDDTVKLIKKRGDNDFSSFVGFGPRSIVNPGEMWSTTISFTSPSLNDPIGDEFTKSLFIDDGKCEAVEPDSVTVEKPLEIRVHFEEASSSIQPHYYTDLDSFGAQFSQLIDQHPNLVIEIEVRADKTEVPKGIKDSQAYINTLSQMRAEVVKTYLINKANVPPEKFTPVINYGISRPLSYSKTEQDKKVNRMVYAHLRNIP